MCVCDTRKSTTIKIRTLVAQSTENVCVCVCEKKVFANFTHEKKTNVMYFLIICFIFNVFHRFFLSINATLNYICTHLRRNVLNCWNSVCVCMYLFSSSSNACGKRNSESSFWVLNIYTMRILRRIYSFNSICRRFSRACYFRFTLALI